MSSLCPLALLLPVVLATACTTNALTTACGNPGAGDTDVMFAWLDDDAP